MSNSPSVTKQGGNHDHRGKTKPFVPYVRVTRVGGRKGDSYQAKDQQLTKIQAHARGHGVELLAGVFIDEDVSGGTMDRKGFNRARALIQRGKAGGIVVSRLDRFARTVEEALVIIRQVEDDGGRLLSADGDITLGNGNDEFVTAVRLAVNQLERSKRAEDLAASVAGAIQRGVHLSAPFGYRKEKGSGLVVFDPEAAVVLLIFELRAQGWSWSRIAAAANATGVFPRPRKRDKVLRQARWTPQTVSWLTRNKAYTGMAYNGEHETPGAHEAIVSHELFAKVEELRGAKPKRRDGEGSEGALLSGGLVRCSGCGHAATFYRVRDRTYYRCRFSQNSKDSCRAPLNASADQLEDYVVSLFKEKALGGVEFDELADGAAVAEAEQAHDEAIATVEAVASQIKPAQSPSTARVLERRLAEADRAVAESAERLAAAQMAARGLQLPPELDEVMFDDAPISDRRQWIASVFESAVVRPSAVWRERVPDRVTLLRKGEAPVGSTTELIGWIASRAW